MKSKVNYLVFAFLFFAGICHSQTRLSKEQFDFFKTIPQETINIHKSNNLLLTGETLYYKIYCSLDSINTLSNLSKIAYVEIIGRDKKTIFKQKVQLNGGLGQGDFFIPTYLSTNSYKLIAYTQWMKNKKAFYEEDLFIVNPFIKSTDENSSKEMNLHEETSVSNSQKLLSTDTSVFSSREKVTLKINSITQDGLEGSYSLSVKIKSPSFYFQVQPNEEDKKKEVQSNSSRLIYLPELRGELIHGRIISDKYRQTIYDKKCECCIVNSSKKRNFKSYQHELSGTVLFQP